VEARVSPSGDLKLAMDMDHANLPDSVDAAQFLSKIISSAARRADCTGHRRGSRRSLQGNEDFSLRSRRVTSCKWLGP
jgi:hypothetical protein